MAQDPSEAYKWILYLNPEVHTQEYKLVMNASLDTFILVQDVRQGPKLPHWLSVLPALVDTKERLAYRGPTCMSKLVSIELPPEHLKRLKRRSKW
jgi:hypothetical protein